MQRLHQHIKGVEEVHMKVCEGLHGSSAFCMKHGKSEEMGWCEW